jgi:hypothetical protein
VLAELDATGQLLLSARILTGAEVTEDPALVRAKLRGDTVRVPHGRVKTLARSYQMAQIAIFADEPSFGTCATRVDARTPSAPLRL